MVSILDFFSAFSEGFMLKALTTALIIGVLGGIIGVFVFLGVGNLVARFVE